MGMTFYGLMKQLGESNPLVHRRPGYPHFSCSLPFQPHHRLSEIPGCEIQPGEVGCAVYDIPVDEGVARIVGKVRVESDGTQTIQDVTAFRIEAGRG